MRCVTLSLAVLVSLSFQAHAKGSRAKCKASIVQPITFGAVL